MAQGWGVGEDTVKLQERGPAALLGEPRNDLDRRAPALVTEPRVTPVHYGRPLEGVWAAAAGQGCFILAPPSSPLQDVLCTPTHRLLQDSQDVPVVVTPLRAERVLLFDDALVLLQVGVGLTPVGCWSLVEKGVGKGQAAETEGMDLGRGERQKGQGLRKGAWPEPSLMEGLTGTLPRCVRLQPPP